jgi:hypothetical protein
MYQLLHYMPSSSGVNMGAVRPRTPHGELQIDWAKVRTEENLDGKYVLVTNELELPAEELAQGYRQLYLVERAFRSMKRVLEIEPVYYWTMERTIDHVYLCVLAYPAHADGGEPHRRVVGTPEGEAGDGTRYGAQDEAPDRIRSGHFQKLRGGPTSRDRGNPLGDRLSLHSGSGGAVVHVPVAYQKVFCINSNLSRSV